MENLLLSTLQDYGLSEKEAKIYLATLEFWPTLASTIARHSGEKRVTTYALLKELVKKWYINQVERNNVQTFSAISPEILCQQLENKYFKFKEVLPNFLSVFEKFSNKTKVQFFEWTEWLERMFAEFATSDINMKTILWTPKLYNHVLLKNVDYYRKTRKEKWLISLRILSDHNVDPKKEKEDDKKHGRKTIIVKDFPFDLNADINIFGPGRVSFLFFENNIPHVAIITNESIYNTFNTLFDYIWNVNTKRKYT